MGRWGQLLMLGLLAVPLAARAAEPRGPEGVPEGAPAALGPEFRSLGAPASEAESLGGVPAEPVGGSLVGTVGSLALVVVLVVVCAAAYRWLVARSGGLAGQAGASRSPAGILDLLGRYPISRGQTLLLLKVDRRVLLVAQSAGSRVGAPPSLTTLCEITDPDEVAGVLTKASAGSEGFGDVIARFSAGRPAPVGPSAPQRADGVEVVDITGGSGVRGLLRSIGVGR